MMIAHGQNSVHSAASSNEAAVIGSSLTTSKQSRKENI
jgi:hypothetical protein